MVFHFGCELHEQYSFSHMLANIEERQRSVVEKCGSKEERNENAVGQIKNENDQL